MSVGSLDMPADRVKWFIEKGSYQGTNKRVYDPVIIGGALAINDVKKEVDTKSIFKLAESIINIVFKLFVV